MIKKVLKLDSEFILFLLLLTTIVYTTSWGGEFLSDDIAGIAQNPNLANFELQLKSFNIVNIFFSLIYETFGPKPFWFHLLNTVFHLATVVVVYVLAYLLTTVSKLSLKKNPKGSAFKIWIPRLTSILFALHPIETEGVTWISGFPYSSYTVFLLVAFLIFVLVDKQKLVFRGVWVSGLFYILALRSSEKAIILPGILFVYLPLFSQLSWKKIKLTLPILGVGVLYSLSLFFQFTKRVADINPTYAGGPTIFNPLLQIPIAVYSYIKLLILPVNLTLYHEYLAFPQWQYYLAVAVTLMLFGGIAFFWRRSRLITFGLSLFFISLLPTFLPISVAWIVAERYVHLGSIGFFLALSTLFYIAICKFAQNRTHMLEKLSKSVAIILVVILSVLTIKRNLEWRSQDTLWPATVKASPYSAYAHNNMGDYYGRHGDYEMAIRAFETARKLRPRYADATHNLGNIYTQIGEATKAAQLFKEALEYNPTLYQSYQNLGRIALAQGEYTDAENYFLQSTKLNPDPFTDYLFLFMVYRQTDNEKNAEQALIAARKLAGKDPQRLLLIDKVVMGEVQ